MSDSGEITLDEFTFRRRAEGDAFAGAWECRSRWHGWQQEFDVVVAAALNEIVRLRDALILLRDWDMLTLKADGTGESLDDARWARETIAEALGESIWVDQ